MERLDKSCFLNEKIVDLLLKNGMIVSSIECIGEGKSGEDAFKINTNQGKYFVKFSNNRRFSEEFLSLLSIGNSKIGNVIQLPIITYNLNEINRQINIYNWIEGINLKKFLNSLTDDACIYYGSRCGYLMKKMHFSMQRSGELKYDLLIKLKQYYDRIEAFGYRFKYNINYKQYLQDNIDILMRDIDPCFIHLDFKPKNLIINKNDIYIVDIDSSRIGDPWLDFYDKAFSLYPSREIFNAALIKGYFDGDIPESFWKYFKVLSVFALIQNTAWILPKKDYVYIRNLESYLWNAYDGFREFIPRWYCS